MPDVSGCYGGINPTEEGKVLINQQLSLSTNQKQDQMSLCIATSIWNLAAGFVISLWVFCHIIAVILMKLPFLKSSLCFVNTDERCIYLITIHVNALPYTVFIIYSIYIYTYTHIFMQILNAEHKTRGTQSILQVDGSLSLFSGFQYNEINGSSANNVIMLCCPNN